MNIGVREFGDGDFMIKVRDEEVERVMINLFDRDCEIGIMKRDNEVVRV
jgi:hypothetical protein